MEYSLKAEKTSAGLYGGPAFEALRAHGLAVSSGAIVDATLTRFATGY